MTADDPERENHGGDDPEARDETIEQRVDDLEDQIGDLDLHDLEAQLETIKTQQERLQENIDALAERTRKESELTPHIDTVKELYLSLEEIESYISSVHEQLDDLRTEIESESE